MRTTIRIVFAHLVLLASIKPARADWLPALSGPVARVAAAGSHAAALRDGEVVILREDGRVVSRLALHHPPIPASEAVSSKQVAEETLDRLEIPEIDRGTDYTDDLVDHESRLAQRRSWRESKRGPQVQKAASSVALATSSSEVWVGVARGIYRVGEEGEPILTFGREWQGTRLAAGQGHLLVDKGNALALLSAAQGDFRTIPLSSPAEHIALSSSGEQIAWAGGAEIETLGPSGHRRFIAPQPVVALAFCGDTLVALFSAGIWAIPSKGKPELRSTPSEARKLLCMPVDAIPWLLIGGRGLWASTDQGQQWDALPGPDGTTLLDIAVSDNHVWLATRAGLFVSVDSTVTAGFRPAKTDRSRPPVRRVPSWLAGLLPKVSLRAAATFQSGRQQIEGFAFAAFPLGTQVEPTSAHTKDETAPGSAVVLPPAQTALAEAEADCLAATRKKAVELAMAEPERARSYVSRAGHAAWLPELRVLVSRRYGRSESLDVDGASAAASSPLGIDTVNDIRYEARATWDLGRLVFSPEELAAQAQALHMAELRREIETTVNRMYFERRRLLVIAPAQQSIAAAEKVRSQELEAELDAMSAGAFGACISEKAAATR